jgi:muramidase (phage lysozyme)
MAAVAALGAGSGIADAVQGFYGGIGKLFGAKPPYKDLETFSQLRVDTAKVKTNSDSFVYFTKAMSSYKGTDGGIGGITSSLAQATVSFFKVKPPEQQVVYFSHLKIDPKQTRINASSFVLFSHAMAEYKGGAGLLDAVSTIAGAKLATLFNVDGPLESFKKFAAIEVGPKAAENAKAFLDFSKAMGILSGGNSSVLGSLAAGAAAAGSAVIGAVASAGAAVGDFISGITNPGPDSKALNFIGKIESGNSYNKLVGGKTKNDPPLTDMTVGQVMAYQDTMRARGHETTALGKYQIIKGTLGGIVKSGAINVNDKFSPTTQDKAAVQLMNMRGREKYKAGKLGPDQYANNLAKEWASLPMPDGRSYYAGQGSNKSLVPRKDFVGALQAKVGGMFGGPSTGYAMELHGTELVIPLDSNSILSKLASTSAESVAKDLQRNAIKATPKPTSTTGIPVKTKGISKEMIHSMSKKFDNVINKIESTNTVQKKLLKHAL